MDQKYTLQLKIKSGHNVINGDKQIYNCVDV